MENAPFNILDVQDFIRKDIECCLSDRHRALNNALANIATTSEDEIHGLVLKILQSRNFTVDIDVHQKTLILKGLGNLIHTLGIYLNSPSNWQSLKTNGFWASDNLSLVVDTKCLSSMDTLARDISRFFGSCQLFNRYVFHLIESESLKELKTQYANVEQQYINLMLNSDSILSTEDFFFCLIKVIFRSMEFEDQELTIKTSKLLVDGWCNSGKMSALDIKYHLESKLNDIIPAEKTHRILADLFNNKL